MNSIILQIASRYVRALLLLFALLALLRGHNNPGGGFIGGLLAGLAIVFEGFAYPDKPSDRSKRSKRFIQSLTAKPELFIFTGFLLVFLSLLPGFFKSQAFMKGEWLTLALLAGRELKLGSPLLFDTGVFFTVIGVTLLFFFAFKKEKSWR